MSQKRKRPQRSVSGWVIFDKPYGMGSTDAVSLIKRLYRADTSFDNMARIDALLRSPEVRRDLDGDKGDE